MKKSAISVKNLTVSYAQDIILKDISFDIPSSSLTFIVGGNGSGKSTLIKSIIGLKAITSGEIKILGKKLSQDVVAKHIAYLPQYSNLERHFPITVKEVIELECELKKSCSIGVKGHLKSLKAEYLSDKTIAELSGGEFQRVLIARTLITGCDILIFDEPTNNLDYDSHKLFKDIIAKQLNNGKTIIIITHNLEELKLSEHPAKILEVRNKTVYERNN